MSYGREPPLSCKRISISSRVSATSWYSDRSTRGTLATSNLRERFSLGLTKCSDSGLSIFFSAGFDLDISKSNADDAYFSLDDAFFINVTASA